MKRGIDVIDWRGEIELLQQVTAKASDIRCVEQETARQLALH